MNSAGLSTGLAVRKHIQASQHVLSVVSFIKGGLITYWNQAILYQAWLSTTKRPTSLNYYY